MACLSNILDRYNNPEDKLQKEAKRNNANIIYATTDFVRQDDLEKYMKQVVATILDKLQPFDIVVDPNVRDKIIVQPIPSLFAKESIKTMERIVNDILIEFRDSLPEAKKSKFRQDRYQSECLRSLQFKSSSFRRLSGLSYMYIPAEEIVRVLQKKDPRTGLPYFKRKFKSGKTQEELDAFIASNNLDVPELKYIPLPTFTDIDPQFFPIAYEKMKGTNPELFKYVFDIFLDLKKRIKEGFFTKNEIDGEWSSNASVVFTCEDLIKLYSNIFDDKKIALSEADIAEMAYLVSTDPKERKFLTGGVTGGYLKQFFSGTDNNCTAPIKLKNNKDQFKHDVIRKIRERKIGNLIFDYMSLYDIPFEPFVEHLTRFLQKQRGINEPSVDENSIFDISEYNIKLLTRFYENLRLDAVNNHIVFNHINLANAENKARVESRKQEVEEILSKEFGPLERSYFLEGIPVYKLTERDLKWVDVAIDKINRGLILSEENEEELRKEILERLKQMKETKQYDFEFNEYQVNVTSRVRGTLNFPLKNKQLPILGEAKSIMSLPENHLIDYFRPYFEVFNRSGDGFTIELEKSDKHNFVLQVTYKNDNDSYDCSKFRTAFSLKPDFYDEKYTIAWKRTDQQKEELQNDETGKEKSSKLMDKAGPRLEFPFIGPAFDNWKDGMIEGIKAKMSNTVSAWNNNTINNAITGNSTFKETMEQDLRDNNRRYESRRGIHTTGNAWGDHKRFNRFKERLSTPNPVDFMQIAQATQNHSRSAKYERKKTQPTLTTQTPIKSRNIFDALRDEEDGDNTNDNNFSIHGVKQTPLESKFNPTPNNDEPGWTTIARNAKRTRTGTPYSINYNGSKHSTPTKGNKNSTPTFGTDRFRYSPHNNSRYSTPSSYSRRDIKRETPHQDNKRRRNYSASPVYRGDSNRRNYYGRSAHSTPDYTQQNNTRRSYSSSPAYNRQSSWSQQNRRQNQSRSFNSSTGPRQFSSNPWPQNRNATPDFPYQNRSNRSTPGFNKGSRSSPHNKNTDYRRNTELTRPVDILNAIKHDTKLGSQYPYFDSPAPIQRVDSTEIYKDNDIQKEEVVKETITNKPAITEAIEVFDDFSVF